MAPARRRKNEQKVSKAYLLCLFRKYSRQYSKAGMREKGNQIKGCAGGRLKTIPV
ncbi:MAG: hypothetical protein M1497_14100 [Nitrospirae bacterium]|nr:hypothetical protein [Nitrospirota bacterium]